MDRAASPKDVKDMVAHLAAPRRAILSLDAASVMTMFAPCTDSRMDDAPLSLEAHFFASVRAGDVAVVQHHLQQHPHLLEARGELQWTALMIAVNAGQQDAARFLLECGSVVDASDGRGATALHLAAMQGRADLTQLLLDNGASPQGVEGARAPAPLLLACMYGHVAVVRALLQHPHTQVDQADPRHGETALGSACQYGHAEVVRALLVEGGADVWAVDRRHRKRPREVAAAYGRRACVQVIEVSERGVCV